jgi:hypothetical protein
VLLGVGGPAATRLSPHKGPIVRAIAWRSNHAIERFRRLIDGGHADLYHGTVVREDDAGEVTERPKVRHWKCRVQATVPRVRIPSSPLRFNRPSQLPCLQGFGEGGFDWHSRLCQSLRHSGQFKPRFTFESRNLQASRSLRRLPLMMNNWWKSHDCHTSPRDQASCRPHGVILAGRPSLAKERSVYSSSPSALFFAFASPRKGTLAICFCDDASCRWK